MAEYIKISGSNKEEIYQSLLVPITELLKSESDTIANMANFSSVLKDAFQYFWVGFYLVKKDSLVLGPFQGSLACTRIGFGKGVCGTAWKEKRSIIVDDVDLFPEHIACSNLSRSEIVLPLLHNQEVWAVLDIDSDKLANFDSVDERYLQKLINLIKPS